jgi:hypothetical protein
MIRTAIVFRRIAVPRQNDFRAHFLSARNRRIKILHLKPQQDAVAMRQFRISNRPMMMLDFPAVQLQQQLAVRNQLLVMTPAVTALAS